MPCHPLGAAMRRANPTRRCAHCDRRSSRRIWQGYERATRLAGIDAEVVERAIASAMGKLGGGKPAAGKFAAGIGHVLAAEDAKRQHLLGLQLRSKLGIEIAPCRLCDSVVIPLLHLVVYDVGSLTTRS